MPAFPRLFVRCVLILLAGTPAARADDASAEASSGGPPFFRELATQRNVQLPAPFGLSLVYSTASQDVLTDSFLITTNGGAQQPGDFARFDNAVVDTNALLLRADVWLLPFLNLFAFAGQSSNDVSGVFSAPVDELVASAGSDACNPDNPDRNDTICDATFESSRSTQTDATQYGAGALLAAGRGPYFALLGIIYSTTAQSDSGAQVNIFTVSPKLGRRWSLGDNGDLALYGAAAWVRATATAQDSVVVETGGAGGLPDPLIVSYDIDLVNDGDWSYGVGANWDINRYWYLQGEFNTGARDSLMAQIGRRFDF